MNLPRIKVRKVPPSHGRSQRHADKREQARERLPASNEDPNCLICDAELDIVDLATGHAICEACREH